MKVTPDTNLLIRILVEDDPEQARRARETLAAASVIAVPLPVLCELFWVLVRGYGRTPAAVADAVEALLHSKGVVTDWPAAEAGLAVVRAGGDFADGAIAQSGAAMGGEVFVSFDAKAVEGWRAVGGSAAQPGRGAT